ncbi:MAG: Uma2 family endonuclease [Pirellula sp.]
MSSLESTLEPIRHSPQLPQIVALLQQQLDEELSRRQKFYQEMTEQQKVEFIDGQILLHSPTRYRHLEAVLRIGMVLKVHVELHRLGTVVVEKCLCVFPRNDYEPDVVFFGPAKTATLTDTTILFPVPDMAVEVLSESTEARDRGVKFQDFAINGVQEYWIVDCEQRSVEQYGLIGNEYQMTLKLEKTGLLKSTAISGLEVNIEAFFDAARNLSELKRLMG